MYTVLKIMRMLNFLDTFSMGVTESENGNVNERMIDRLIADFDKKKE